ncbi:translation initiation factor IF-2-like [Acinonyx jubatus]|uniref:Translation initiation factor IF-2-like n=1 Tax=Acinonyx jubatus TaxID=32536 RepID=A0ABM3Q789_ACIJB|nr:translation initiation factor IF-2-like [Acinonyx jubatus]
MAPRLTGTRVAAQTSPLPPWADLSCPREAGAGRRAPGGRGRGGGWRARRGRVSAPGLPLSGPRGGSHFGGQRPGPLRAPCRPRGRLRRETPAPARPGTHAGFMAAGSVLPGGARGTPGSIWRAGEGGRPQGRATGSGTPRLRRGAPRSGSTPPRAQVSSRPAHFKRANQRPPAGKGRGLRGNDCSAGSGARLLGDRGSEARVVCVSGLRSDVMKSIPFHFPMKKLRAYFTTVQEVQRKGQSSVHSEFKKTRHQCKLEEQLCSEMGLCLFIHNRLLTRKSEAGIQLICDKELLYSESDTEQLRNKLCC